MICKNCGHRVAPDQRVRNCLLHVHPNGVWISQKCGECKCMKPELEVQSKYFEGIDSTNPNDCRIACGVCPFESKCKVKDKRGK